MRKKIKDWIYNKFFKDEYEFTPLKPFDVPKIEATGVDIQKLAAFVPYTNSDMNTLISHTSNEMEEIVKTKLANKFAEYIKPYIEVEFLNNKEQMGFYGKLEVVNRHDK